MLLLALPKRHFIIGQNDRTLQNQKFAQLANHAVSNYRDGGAAHVRKNRIARYSRRDSPAEALAENWVGAPAKASRVSYAYSRRRNRADNCANAFKYNRTFDARVFRRTVYAGSLVYLLACSEQ